MYVEKDEDEDVYYIYTNKDNNLILVTKDCKLAVQVNAALKNMTNDSEFRIKVLKNKKAAW